ncbi:MAG: DUF561 domain-containing protein [Candidatus Melainabacteria bacterium]|nr:DUF561 domain-containing protein [Candidatus Melainabacteria bacterium]
MNQTLRIQAFQKSLQQRNALKVIAGISNFDEASIVRVVNAATRVAGTSAVDVAACPDVIAAIRPMTDRLVFASSIRPEALEQAIRAGADAVELGNYDALYEEGLFLTPDDVLRITRETLRRLDAIAQETNTPRAFVCVTVPGHLSAHSQERLAQALETLGVDLLQTEGASRMLASEPRIQVLPADQKAAVTFNNTRLLSAAVHIPVMSASGITVQNVMDAFQAGASAVGVGSSVNKLSSTEDMVQVLGNMVAQLQEHQAIAPVRVTSLVS